MIYIILDHLVRMKIIQSCSFINWFFSKDMADDFTRYCTVLENYVSSLFSLSLKMKSFGENVDLVKSLKAGMENF